MSNLAMIYNYYPYYTDTTKTYGNYQYYTSSSTTKVINKYFYSSNTISINNTYYNSQIEYLENQIIIVVKNELNIILLSNMDEADKINEIMNIISKAPTLKPVILSLLKELNDKLGQKVEKFMCLK